MGSVLLAWVQTYWPILLLLISELLPLIPGVQSNSIWQLLLGGIKQLLASAPKPPAP